jgi:hypothetical protein
MTGKFSKKVSTLGLVQMLASEGVAGELWEVIVDGEELSSGEGMLTRGRAAASGGRKYQQLPAPVRMAQLVASALHAARQGEEEEEEFDWDEEDSEEEEGSDVESDFGGEAEVGMLGMIHRADALDDPDGLGMLADLAGGAIDIGMMFGDGGMGMWDDEDEDDTEEADDPSITSHPWYDVEAVPAYVVGMRSLMERAAGGDEALDATMTALVEALPTPVAETVQAAMEGEVDD